MLKITILLPVHQREDIELNFEKTFMSIIKNTYKNFELILLIDGKLSLSFYKKIYELKKKKNFKILFSSKVGLPKLLNKGIKMVKTKWIARVDADDIYLKDFLENAIKLIQKGYDLFGGQINEINSKNKLLFKKRLPTKESDIKKYIKYRNPFNHMTVFYKTKIVKQLGGYPNFNLKEDYALWIKFINSGARVCNSHKVFANARITPNFFKRRNGFDHIRSEIQIQKLLLKYKLTNFFIACIIFSLRSLSMLMPVIILKFLYINILRK